MRKKVALDALAAALSPYLGDTMARASARTHCDKLAIDGEDMSAAQTDALLGRIGGTGDANRRGTLGSVA
jgi:hypothetical protein